MAAFRAFSFARLSEHIQQRKSAVEKLGYNNEMDRISRDTYPGLTPKQYRRHWLKERKRAIYVSALAVVICQVYYVSPWGSNASAYIQLYWKRLKQWVEPQYHAPLSARETIARSCKLEPALKQELTEWFLKVDLVQAQGVNGEWLQSLLSTHVPSVSVPAAVTLNDFLSIASQAPDPTALLASLKTASERELGEYAAIMTRLEAAKTAANKKHVAFEQKRQKEEDDHYLKHFQVVSKKQLEALAKKVKKYPESVRLLSRKALLEAEMAVNKSR